MLKKRLIGTVIVKDGWAVQSFGYKRYLPLGKPECLIENLDRWGADEILVLCIDRYKNRLGPDFDLLNRIGKLGLETPLIYGGGIKSIENGVSVIQEAADRICVDSLLHEDLKVVAGLSSRLGTQAVLGVMPVDNADNSIQWHDYRSRKSTALKAETVTMISKNISEIVLVDWKNEGMPNGFQQNLVEIMPDCSAPLIVFGGISNEKQMEDLLAAERVSAVSVGNFLSYKEHSIQRFKKLLTDRQIRKYNYRTENTLIYR